LLDARGVGPRLRRVFPGLRASGKGGRVKAMADSGKIIGIDLGTTNSVVAVMEAASRS
jgi:hypothetical protein